MFLLCVWAVTIFCFSAQNADKSSDTSGSIVEKIVTVIYPDYEDISVSAQTQITDIVTLLVRKAAHFSEYFILGLLSFWAAISFEKTGIKLSSLLSVGFCVLYSISDEIHQYFVPGRACRFIDICIDAAGSISAVIIFAAILNALLKARGAKCVKRN